MFDVVIIGDGVIGLSTALELGRAGARCCVYGALHHEAASGAAAGLLAPSIGNLSTRVRPFFAASLARYPEFIARLREFEPALSLVEGLLDVSADASRAHRDFGAGDRLTSSQVSALDPEVFAPNGALFHARDSAVDNQLLGRALRRAVASFPTVTMVDDDPVINVDLGGTSAVLHTRGGSRSEATKVVLAAGAWSSQVRGLPRSIPVRPLKGQMLALASNVLRHAVMAEDIYLVPRATEIAAGATVEEAGFDITVVAEDIERMRQAAIQVCPALRQAPVRRAWAGLRPATPDMLPILGPDPDDSRLVYACGHSKNGILLAPATGAAIGAVALGQASSFDLSPFAVDRFCE